MLIINVVRDVRDESRAVCLPGVAFQTATSN